MESKWYVVVETQKDGKDYVGINDDSYTGGNIISEHDSENEADAACTRYAQEHDLPLFADYRHPSVNNQIIELPDGYNGHTAKFYIEPIEVEGDLVKLQCAEPGKEYMARWCYSSVITEKPQPASRS